MNGGMLNEHDAHRGAESKGEFFGMTGNSAWYLFGASGASVLLVIVLWGMLGLSLLLCLLLGLLLCGLSVAYVFALKNNKPSHYDTDFFESALVEAGVTPLAFGPRPKRPANPFRSPAAADELAVRVEGTRASTSPVRQQDAGSLRGVTSSARAEVPVVERRRGTEAGRRSDDARFVPVTAFERLQNELNTTTEMLEEALAEREEDRLCE